MNTNHLVRDFSYAIVLAWTVGPTTLLAAEPLKLPLEFTVEVVDKPRIDAPVMATLATLPVAGQSFRLREITSGKNEAVDCQMEAGTPPKLWWFATRSLPAGGKRTYRLEAGDPVEKDLVTVSQSETGIEVRMGTASVLKYNSAHVDPPAGIDARNGRSGYVHPVWTPAGKIVTEQFPQDHPHQSGVFLAHVKTQFEGRDVDFWNLVGGKGRVQFKQALSIVSGSVFGEFRVQHQHIDLTVPNGKVAAIELWDLRVWKLGGASSGYYVWDITSSLRCASASPLKLAQFHYGGMAIRGSGQWSGQNARFVTAEGKGRVDGNHSRPRWCDLSGPTDEGVAGITLVSHPSNFRFPEPLRIHPTMPYMVYTPAHLGEWELAPGAAHVSRYRFVAHDGDIKPEIIENLAQNFAEPLLASPQP